MEFKSMTYDGKIVSYKESFWTGKKEITIDGQLLKKADKKSFFYNDERYIFKGSFLFGAELIRNEERIILVPKLTALEWIFVILPLILIAIGGWIGALCGITAAIVFLSLSRVIKSNLLRFILGIATTACAYIVWFVVAVIILAMTGGAA